MSISLLEVQGAAEESFDLEDRPGCELIDGVWVEKSMSAQASRVSVNVIRLIDTFALAHQLGLVFSSEVGYRIFGNRPKKRIRKPDGSFIRRGRLPHDKAPQGEIEIVPDLVTESVSPNDTAEEIEERVVDYLEVGVPLMWVIYPKNRTAYVYRKDKSVARLTATDQLSGEDVLPGFSCRVEELFVGI
jgi:Uma2 family endonuclease